MQKLHKFPHEILELPREERAFVYGSVMVKAKAEEKLAGEVK